MDYISSQQPYLIGERIKHSVELPFLALDIKDNTCVPKRKVFQILHKHEEIEFIIVLKNKLHIQTTMSEIIVNEGEGAFIPKNVLHVLNTYDNCVCHAFLFPDLLLVSALNNDMYEDVKKYTENPMMDLVLIEQSSDEQAIIKKLDLLSAIAFKDSHESFYKFKLLATLYDLWFTFISSIDIDAKSVMPIQKVQGDRLKRYLEFIQLNYDSSISVKDIANGGYTSVSECNRIFKKLMNTTAYEYLIKYRIHKSLELMKLNQYTISRIAHEVGYSSPSQFTKYFKRHMNVTPTAYIKSIGKYAGNPI
ncbi:AraC family transcriptional regulator [Vallitalea okinawensis]|uniref:AraC family transcriptional regulator n=1 Tax=Vallitalea okinawensis TaxID=2078660 RepID=UPI000CFAA15C|nr:AraC family transcriptional regulator [Vallitalea okinawensis]